MRILVVEDQDELRAILRDFVSASGYTLIEAVDGGEGVAKAASERPDLVLMVCSTGRSDVTASMSLPAMLASCGFGPANIAPQTTILGGRYR